MAEPVKWSSLFRIGGSKSGAAFKRVTLKADTPMPYVVNPFERLIIPKMTTPVIIDPSGLQKDDDSFQIYDSGRNFNNNPVIIKANPNLTIADAGQDADGNNLDLSLNIVGGGSVWEFVLSDKALVVSDAPAFLGDGTGGSSPSNGGTTPTPAPASGGGANVILTGKGNPKTTLTYPVAGLGGPQAILYIDSSDIGNTNDFLTNPFRTYIWPANTPDDGAHDKWEPSTLSTLKQLIYLTDEIDNDHKLFFTGKGDPSELKVADLVTNPNPKKGGTGYVNAVYLDSDGTGFWVNVHETEGQAGEKWINIGGGNGGGSTPAPAPFDTNAFLQKNIYPLMMMRAPIFVGDTDPDPNTSKFVGGELDSLYLNKTSGQWFVWPKEHMIVEGGPQNNLWRPISSDGATVTITEKTVQQFIVPNPEANTDTFDAAPGDFVRVTFQNFRIDATITTSEQSRNAVMTLPAVQPNNLKPIRVIRDGYLPLSPNPYESATLKIVPANGVRIVGVWDGFDMVGGNDKGIKLDEPGEYVEFTPVLWHDKDNKPITAWVITSSNYTQDDTDVIETTTDVTAAPGQTIIARAACNVTVPDVDLNDLSPIVIMHHPMPDGTTDYRVSIYVSNVNGSFRGTEYYMYKTPDPKAQAALFLVEPGDWIKLEPYGTGSDKFWIITGGSEESSDPVEVVAQTVTPNHGDTLIVRNATTVNLPNPDPRNPAPITIMVYPSYSFSPGNPPPSQANFEVTITTTLSAENRGMFGQFPAFNNGNSFAGVAGDGTFTMGSHGSWVRFEAAGGLADPCWILTGGWHR